jgi:hypothetical protein
VCLDATVVYCPFVRDDGHGSRAMVYLIKPDVCALLNFRLLVGDAPRRSNGLMLLLFIRGWSNDD